MRDEASVLTARKKGAVRPKSAASLALIDHSGRTTKVLMGRRHPDHIFMPDKYVFPGGRVDPLDQRMATASPLHKTVEEKLLKRVTRPSPARARAQALAAIRETFEETGLVLGSRVFGAPPKPPAGIWSEFAATGVFPTLDNLHFVARAVTPPHFARRFDTAFFCADASAIAAEVAGKVGPSSELVEIVWVPLREALDLDLLDITGFVLDEIRHRMALGMRYDLPVPFYHGPAGRRIRDTL